MHSACDSLENIFGIKIKNEYLFILALTHSSINCDSSKKDAENYERLEFLGDAVLKLCISDILYKKYPLSKEGDLSNIRSFVVSDETIFKFSSIIGLDSLLIFGGNVSASSLRKKRSVVACAFEAVLGAFYLDGSLFEILEYLRINFNEKIEEIEKNFHEYNAKAILQEFTQSQTKTRPIYSVVEQSGPAHNRLFTVEVSYQNEILASGCGKTKREAEQICAKLACFKLGVLDKIKESK